MTKVCRLCLIKLQRGSRYFNINAVESFTGFMPYRDQLTTCIPEMALDLIPSPVICNNCRTALKSAYDFKNRCLLVEKKIQSFIENQNLYEINYDLSQISTDDLPPLNKFSLLAPSSEEDIPFRIKKIPTDDLPPLTKFSLLAPSSVEDIPIRIKKDLFNESVQNTESSSTESNGNVKTEPKELFEESLIPKNIVHRRRPYKGGRSHGIFTNEVFTCDFICNFCHESFKSLQALRKHNNICLKTTQTEKSPNILTKRPHLPTKAKNHLKKWLFRHTDHPYPTDQEKQMLMQETNLSLLQVENWFINARRRILQDLTKLKHRGVKTEDIHDSRLGLEMEYEELVPQSGLQNMNFKYFATNPLEEINLPPAPENMIKEEFIEEEEDEDMKQDDDEEEEDGEKQEEEEVEVEVEKWGDKQKEVPRQIQQIEVIKEHDKNEEEIKVDLSTVKCEEIESR